MIYICQICGYIYDDTKEKVPFSELPADWKCPLCGASKSDFRLADNEVKETGKKSVEAKENQMEVRMDADMEKISVGQLSALCSNLARGCEKQYNTEEAGLFKQLADYFSSFTPIVKDASVEKISQMLQNDVNEYASVRVTSDTNGDRGAARVCVWGEKVSRILSLLVDRYLNEGEQMLANTNIWVCTVCGFVYIGDKAPDLCPVCKVPDWKFEKIEGRE